MNAKMFLPVLIAVILPIIGLAHSGGPDRVQREPSQRDEGFPSDPWARADHGYDQEREDMMSEMDPPEDWAQLTMQLRRMCFGFPHDLREVAEGSEGDADSELVYQFIHECEKWRRSGTRGPRGSGALPTMGLVGLVFANPGLSERLGIDTHDGWRDREE